MKELWKKYGKLEFVIGAILMGVLLIVLLGLYMYKNSYRTIDELNVQNIDVKKDLEVSSDENYFYLRGWSCILGESILDVDVSLILWDEEEQKGYLIPTKLQERPDVTTHFNDGYNYDNSGFVAVIRKDKLKEKKYKVYIRYQNNDCEVDSYMGKVLE